MPLYPSEPAMPQPSFTDISAPAYEAPFPSVATAGRPSGGVPSATVVPWSPRPSAQLSASTGPSAASIVIGLSVAAGAVAAVWWWTSKRRKKRR